ncbi:zinc finger protein 84-like [Triplophysa rosa]|uniref:Zinc finger protein 84-like n=2 Tax=Triplophysa rosa TaxID=992332 RepID=A0A9W7WXG9_TRIRA|nr:zinc finger protein 84-like [Triplophysa rosa]
MSHCSFQTQFASIMDLLAEAALAEIHRRVDDRCALARKDIDALKRKCVMMEIELRRVKGRCRKRVWISGTSDRCPTSLKSGRVITSQQHPPNPQHIHNIREVVGVLDDDIRSPEIKEERDDERDVVAFVHEQQNVQGIPPQENTASPEAPSEDPEVQNSPFLRTGTYTQPPEQLKHEEECLRLQVKVKEDFQEEEETSRDPLRYAPLWPSVPEATRRSPNSPVLSQTHRNHQHPTERAQKSIQVSAKEPNASAWRREVTQDPGHQPNVSTNTFPAVRGTPGDVRRIRTRRRSTVDAVQRFSCSFCAKTFKRCDQLKEHLRSHTGEKPFVCVQCGHSFTKHSNLTRHAVVHSGEKPFQCLRCGKCFTRRCNLTSHQRIHSGNIT